MKKIIRIILRVLLVLVLIPVTGLLMIFLNYHMISFSAQSRVYERSADIAFRKYTLVMGAGHYKPDKWINHTFNHRMYTAVKLYTEKKTDKIIASGTRTSDYYDEVSDMRNVLLEYGIPRGDIITDFGGNRTWTSVLRAHKYHKADTIIIVSQRDQLERALFAASCMGVNAVGLLAEPSPWKHRAWTIREYLARVKCTWDCISYKFRFQ
jgi:SanA protein